MKLPVRTVQRLSRYRRLLLKYRYLEEPHIYSHDLARLCNLNPVQVRRDLMLIGSSGNHRRGYNVNMLIKLITENIDTPDGQRVCIIGMGKLAQAITHYLQEHEIFQHIVATFDIDPVKVGKQIDNIPCYDIRQLGSTIEQEKISMAVLTVPSDFAASITSILVDSGISGILNFTSISLAVPKGIYVRDFNIINTLEEIAYFVKNKNI